MINEMSSHRELPEPTMRLPSIAFQHGLLPRLAMILVAVAAAITFPSPAVAQASRKAPPAREPKQNIETGIRAEAQQNTPVANPGRPTVSTPATLTPVGYLQFETGLLAAWHSPEFSTQQSLGEVIKFTVSQRIQLLAGTSPFVHSNTAPQNGTGDITLGAQGVIYRGEGPRPTLALSYFRDVFSGGTPDLDIGSASNSAIFLASADVKGFHYDTNYLFNEVINDGVRRAQFGQTLSVSHAVGKNFGISGEIWNFTQPFLRGHATGNLWAVNYNARKNLVFDLGFNRGLTTTSTRWELLAGFTYVLPIKLQLH